MPIYEYRCGSCGFEKEYLQKVNDVPVAACPACGSNVFTKLISAAGFQLKGSGWYATDFKNGGKPNPKPDKETAAAATATKNETVVTTKPAADTTSPACATD